MYSFASLHVFMAWHEYIQFYSVAGKRERERRKRDGQTFSFDKFMVMTTCGFFSYDNDDDDDYDDHNDNCS